jgi:hypothetical protein
MQHLESSLLTSYESALRRLHELEQEFVQHLAKIHEVADGSGASLRQLAFLEGLRRERDDMRLAVQQAEAAVINRISKALGIPPEGSAPSH